MIIGLNVPLTGAYNDQGKDEEMAYKLAIDQINAKGGVFGKKIEYILKDTKADAATAKQNAINLLKIIGEKKSTDVVMSREENPVILEPLPGEK